MRAVALLVPAILLISCATPHEHWGDEDQGSTGSGAQAAAAPAPAQPPVSFVVPPSGDQSDLDLDAASAQPSAPAMESAHAADSGESENATGQGAESASPAPVIVDVPPSPPPRTKHRKQKPAPEVAETESSQAPSSDQAETDAQVQKMNQDLSRLNDTGTSGGGSRAAESSVMGTSESLPSAVEQPEKPDPTLHRDPSWVGVSITAGAGALLASGARPGYQPALAYGAQITLDPKFLGDFALDLGAWRATSSTGSTFEQVQGSQNQLSVRIMYLPRIGAGFFTGVGVGGLLTFTTAQYQLEGQAAVNAAAPQLGADVTYALGWRISHFETRLDLRALLSGGLRLEFLPELSVGVTF